MSNYVDLTDSPPNKKSAAPNPRRGERSELPGVLRDVGEESVLQCDNVMLILPTKVKVTGTLRLVGAVLAFKPQQNDDCMHCMQVESAAVQSMQVSKAGSAKPLLKLVGGSSTGTDATFDFSQVTNGCGWRDTLKDAIATLMRSSQESSSSSAARGADSAATATAGAGRSNTNGSASSGSICSKAGGSTGGRDGNGGGQASVPKDGGSRNGTAAGNGNEAVMHRLDAAAIFNYFTKYPKLLQVYQKVVPDQMSEHDFWRRFLEARFSVYLLSWYKSTNVLTQKAQGISTKPPTKARALLSAGLYQGTTIVRSGDARRLGLLKFASPTESPTSPTSPCGDWDTS